MKLIDLATEIKYLKTTDTTEINREFVINMLELIYEILEDISTDKQDG